MSNYHNFRLLQPLSIDDALELLVLHGEDAKIMAGGQTLLIMMREGLIQPEAVIDLLKVPELNRISLDPQANMITIGSLTTHRAIEKNSIIQQQLPLLHDAYKKLASVQVRNRGTIGGNLCHNAPGSDPAVALLVLDAEVLLQSTKANRWVSVEEFGTDYFETDLKETEIMTQIKVPLSPAGARSAYIKFSLRESDYPFVSVAVLLHVKDGRCTQARIGLGGVASAAIRATQAEQFLVGTSLTQEIIVEAATLALDVADPISDSYASADYRLSITPVIVRRAIQSCLT